AKNLFLPFKHDDDGVILPLVGGIHVNGQDITEDPEKMGKLGISLVKTDNGKDVKHPGFVLGGRSVLFPGTFHLPTFKTKEGGYAFLDTGTLEGVLSGAKGDEWLAERKKDIEEPLRARWEREPNGMSWEEYQRTEGEAAFFHTMTETLQMAGERGGREIAKLFKGNAVQLKGVGLDKYMYHAVKKNPDGSVEARPEDRILLIEGGRGWTPLAETDFEFAERPEYAGKSGTFLDVRHQYWSAPPTGGLASAKRDVERDRMLFGRGARMSGITVGYVPMISKVQLDEVMGDTRMVCEETVMSLRVILDDSNRLSALGHPEKGRATRSFERQMMVETGKGMGEYDDADRDKYLDTVSDNIGVNLKVVLDEKLTVPWDQKTRDNMSVYGGIVDSADFREMVNRYQSGSLVRRWYIDLMDTVACTGMSKVDYLKSAHFRKLASNFLGSDGEKVAREVSLTNDKSIEDTAATLLSRAWIKKSLKEDGRTLSTRYLFNQLKDDKEFRADMGFSKGQVVNHIGVLEAGKTSSIDVVIPERKGLLGSTLPQINRRMGKDEFFDRVRDAYIDYLVMREKPSLEHGADSENRGRRPEVSEQSIDSGVGHVQLKKVKRDRKKRKKNKRRKR
ncbi:hypothetical protein ACFLRF_06430, partial [Candidatus Altiarchaeota archaeon]